MNRLAVLAEIEAVCLKHNVMLIGADYHAGVIIAENKDARVMTLDTDDDGDLCIEFSYRADKLERLRKWTKEHPTVKEYESL